ncbi:N-acetyltransferase eso1, partial [Coemansia sp. RSA 1804]
VNYPARNKGIRRMDTVREALDKCSELQLVHVATFSGTSPPDYHPSPSVTTHKVSLDGYRRASREIMGVIRRLCPTMSKASIDEAYLDVSSIVKEQIISDFGRGALEWASDEEAARADDDGGLSLFGQTQHSEPDVTLPTPA